jgi:hypothetical protein
MYKSFHKLFIQLLITNCKNIDDKKNERPYEENLRANNIVNCC